MSRYIDLHCERIQEGFFEEPLNALSNLGFIIAAFYLYKFIKTKKNQPFSNYFLVYLCGFIGLGSMTFHITAKMWAAMYFDVLPIAVFAATFMYLFSRHILRLGMVGTTLLLALLIFENFVFKSYVGRAPDGYVSLIPSAFFLLFICIFMIITKNRSTKNICIATAIAIVAIFCRATDMYFCDVNPYGMHFIWHSLMGVFMYIVTRELIIRHRSHDAPAPLTP